MTAIVGYCFQNGAFMAADTRRTLHSKEDGKFIATYEVIKLFKLNENIWLAHCGHPIDEARLQLHIEVTATTKKKEITDKAIVTYGKYLSIDDEADTTLFLFGHEDNAGFIRKLEWNVGSKSFDSTDYVPGDVVTGGYYDNVSKTISETELKKISSGRAIPLNFWSQLVMNKIILAVQKIAQIEGYVEDPIAFPIDQVIVRADKKSHYERCNELIVDLELRIPTDDVTVPILNHNNSFTVRI